MMTAVNEGDELRTIRREDRWRPLAELSVVELRARAADYRRMAATATTIEVVHGLLRVAERFDAMANCRHTAEGGNS